MKKYGDDADQFHNQGTRVEESKKWHEQHQLRHKFSYNSSPKPKSTYSPEPKPAYKRVSKWKKCHKCGNKYDKFAHEDCPYCVKSKPMFDNSNWIKCPNCNKQYNTNKYSDCPHCKKSKYETYNKSKKYYKPKLNRDNYKSPPLPMWKKCPKCGKFYNENKHDYCPHCIKLNTSIEISIVVVILLIILLMVLFNLML